MNFVVENEDELVEKIWRNIEKYAQRGVCVGLSGDLGSGKTTFVRGLAESMGVKDAVSSPTFALAKQYKTERSDLPVLQHIDLYRIENASSSDIHEIADLLNNDNALTFIEWPEKIKEVMQRLDLMIAITPVSNHARKVEIYEVKN